KEVVSLALATAQLAHTKMSLERIESSLSLGLDTPLSLVCRSTRIALETNALLQRWRLTALLEAAERSFDP
ncbi:MAG: hypothetical protein AAB250_17440, partial [Bdellovibrionota bacterium]